MAKCSGCTSVGCNCSLEPGDNVTITGDGSALLPYTISASGGGGGGGQVLYYTVGTPGIVAFGNLAGTPAPLLATADFVGDGVNDSVAIQAAIDAVAALAPTLQNAIVLILPGIFVTPDTIDTKGVRLIGMGSGISAFVTDAGFGASANTRTIDNSVSTGMIWIEDLSLTNGTLAAVIYGPFRSLIRVNVNGSAGSGADAASVVATSSVPLSPYNTIKDSVISGANWAISLNTAGWINISNCNIISGLLLTGSNNNIITGNIFAGGLLDSIRLTSNSSENIIEANYISFPGQHGININASDENLIAGNRLIGYDAAGTAAFDGIFITNGSDFNTVQTNRCGHNTARYGINVNNGTSNMVTNNDLRLGGVTATFIDTATLTITAAGNRL